MENRKTENQTRSKELWAEFGIAQAIKQKGEKDMNPNDNKADLDKNTNNSDLLVLKTGYGQHASLFY